MIPLGRDGHARYHNVRKIEPLERAPYREGVEVFPERGRRSGATGIWQHIKQELAKEMPDLLNMTAAEEQEEFDRLSNVIAERMPFSLLEEFERALRGDEHGLVGY